MFDLLALLGELTLTHGEIESHKRLTPAAYHVILPTEEVLVPCQKLLHASAGHALSTCESPTQLSAGSLIFVDQNHARSPVRLPPSATLWYSTCGNRVWSRNLTPTLMRQNSSSKCWSVVAWPSK